MTSVPSLLFCVGDEYYKLWEFIAEAEEIGASKRVALTAIPDGLVRGLSKMFFAHGQAIVKVTAPGKTLADLAYALLEEGIFTPVEWSKLTELDLPYWTGGELQAFDPVPECMLDITVALSKLKVKRLRELTETFGLQFCQGIIGYSPFNGFQVVLDKDEQTLPESLSVLAPLVDTGYVEMVHVVYADEEEREA